MKHYIKFHKAFLPATIVSLVLIAFSVLGLLTRGFNMGVDFKAGVNQYVQLAFQADGISLTIESGAAELPALLLVPTYAGEFVLSETARRLHRSARDINEGFGDLEKVRQALASLTQMTVKEFGDANAMQYVIRISDDGSNPDFAETVHATIGELLAVEFGAGHFVMMQTDYVGASFSQSLMSNSWKLVIGTLGLILLYATFRFKLKFALGAVLALVHDAFIMMGFMIWSGMEFNTISIAAILTILGYSINDTIIIFDRVREDKKLAPTDSTPTILDRSVNETLGRTFITSGTTLLAVFALFFFTKGSVKDFALALIVGIVAGTYSSVFIASAFVRFWDHVKGKRIARLEAAGKPGQIVKATN